VEAGRLLCLSAARSDKQEEFEKGILLLRGWSNDSWARSNLNFLLGFKARLEGRVPDAERYFREAYREVPNNFPAARELASISLMRGDLETAETFARKSLLIAPDNPYLLDILLGVLISGVRGKPRGQRPEIEFLFERLEQAAQTDDRSFYATRRAEYEYTHGNPSEAGRLIDEAADKTPDIFAVHALRAKIYLDRGIKSIAWEELEKMRRVVYRTAGGERRSNLRPLLEIEALYATSTGDYENAKSFFRTKGVFTDDEAQQAIKGIEYEQAMMQR
jgi:tetratricopeptide (TPR) repeat protein